MAFDPTSSDIQSFSGAPSPPPPLSGLLFGGGLGLSGSGAGAGLGGGRGGPGMEGGPGLDILSLLAQLTGGGDTGGALRPGLGQPLGGGGTSLGPSAGGFDATNPFFQTIGQQGIAGQTAGQMQGGQGSQGSLLGLLKALASIGQKGAGLFQSLQQRGGGGGGGEERGFASPGEPGLASPTITSDPFFSTLFQDPAVRDAFLSGQFGSFGANFEQGGQFGPPGLGFDTQSALANAPFGPEGNTSGPGFLNFLKNIGAGTLGNLFGATSGAAGTAQDIQRGDPLGTVQNLFGLYSNLAPLSNQFFNTGLPTTQSIVQDLGNLLGLGNIGGQTLSQLFGGGTAAFGTGLAEAATGGVSEAVTQAVAQALEEAAVATLGESLGAIVPVAGAALAGAMHGGQNTQFSDTPLDLLVGIGDLLGIRGIDVGVEKVFNNLAEAQRNTRNIGFARPIIQQGAGLPQALLAAEQSGDPDQIAKQVELARYIIDQGPALSQVQPGIKGWGPFKNPLAGNQQFSQMMSQDMHNAFNAYSQGIADLQRMGKLTPNAGEGTLMGPSGLMFGGSSPVDPRSLFNMMGNDPFGYGALYRSWFPPSIHGQGGGGDGGGIGWTPPLGPANPPPTAAGGPASGPAGGLLAPSGPNANTAAFQQMIQQNLGPLGIQSASLMAPGGPNDQTAQFLQMIMKNLGPLGIQVA